MRILESEKRKDFMRRSIEISTYEYDGQRLVVEGFLKDDRFHASRIITGESFPAGVIHHMAIRLLINCSNMVIEDIEAEASFGAARNLPRNAGLPCPHQGVGHYQRLYGES